MKNKQCVILYIIRPVGPVILGRVIVVQLKRLEILNIHRSSAGGGNGD